MFFELIVFVFLKVIFLDFSFFLIFFRIFA